MKKIKISCMLAVFLILIFSVNCKRPNIRGSWKVKIKYNGLARQEVIPIKSIFEFRENNKFYINQHELKEKYKQKGKIIRIKISINNEKYVIRGIIEKKRITGGEIKKIITDEIIGTWTAKRI